MKNLKLTAVWLALLMAFFTLSGAGTVLAETVPETA